MKQTIKCCDFFGKMRHHFDWFSYQDDNGQKVYCMPVLKSCDGHTKLRINHCPSCGKEVRNIELRDEK
jgi:hypothetical protein